MPSVDYPLDFDASASGQSAQVIQVETLGRGGIAALLLGAFFCITMAAIAIGIAMRAQDRATLAEREARIATDKLSYMHIELSKRGIHVEQH